MKESRRQGPRQRHTATAPLSRPLRAPFFMGAPANAEIIAVILTRSSPLIAGRRACEEIKRQQEDLYLLASTEDAIL